MRVLLLILALPLLATFAPKSLARAPQSPPVLRLFVEPVPLSADAPARRSLGKLRFLGGWWLRSNDPHFGGISAIHVERGLVTALNDAGRLYFFAVPKASGAAPLGGRWLTISGGEKKHLRDSEAMAVHGDRVWVSFERTNAVARYDGRTWRPEADSRPEAMREWARNAGAEAMIRLADGSFLLFSEGRRGNDGSTEALLFRGDPADPKVSASRLRYRAPDGFRITDAAELPDGRLLFLNRRVSLLDGFQVKVTIAAKPDLDRTSLIEGREIAHFGPDVSTDNYEAVSITREGDRTILWIASDDNYMAFQRTLLMKFALED